MFNLLQRAYVRTDYSAYVEYIAIGTEEIASI